MGATLEICLYSGICHLDPKSNISDEDTEILKNMLESLSEVLEEKPHQWLGPNQYLVHLNNEDKEYFYCQPGSVTKYKVGSEDFVSYKDTAGIFIFLATYSATAMVNHQEEMKTQWDKYNEEMLRISKQEKV